MVAVVGGRGHLDELEEDLLKGALGAQERPGEVPVVEEIVHEHERLQARREGAIVEARVEPRLDPAGTGQPCQRHGREAHAACRCDFAPALVRRLHALLLWPRR